MMILLALILSLIPLCFIPLMWPAMVFSMSLTFLYSLLFCFHDISNPALLSSLFMTDPLSSMLTSLTFWIILNLLITNTKYLTAPPYGKYSLMFILSLLLLLVTFNTHSFFLFYISFETTLIPIIFIIFGWGYQPERIPASTYLLMYTISASLPLLLVFLTLNNFMYSNNFILPSLMLNPFSMNHMLWIMSILAFLVKMPCFFLHLWLPKAHVEAPTTGSMLLAAILLKLGSYGLMRMLTFTYSISMFLNTLLIISNLMGSLYVSLMCMKQTDIKALIAYSSVVHMSLMASGLLTFSHLAWSSAIILMLGHALCSSAMFALAGTNYDLIFSRSLLMNKGLIMVFPSLTLWWFLFSAFNMSAPPSINIASEILILSSISYWHPLTCPLLIMSSFFTGMYTLYLYSSSQHSLSPLQLYPSPAIKLNTFLVLSLHLFPLITLILKLNLLM